MGFGCHARLAGEVQGLEYASVTDTAFEKRGLSQTKQRSLHVTIFPKRSGKKRPFNLYGLFEGVIYFVSWSKNYLCRQVICFLHMSNRRIQYRF